jgi:hypothetical protein
MRSRLTSLIVFYTVESGWKARTAVSAVCLLVRMEIDREEGAKTRLVVLADGGVRLSREREESHGRFGGLSSFRRRKVH